MNPGPFPPRACRTCGATVPADQPCAACALAQLLSEDPVAPGRDPVPATVAEDAGFDATALPCRLGPFLVRRELAVGGMGAVYEAEDTRSRRTVALKLLRSLLLVSDADKARFKVEAEAAASLDHPNIVPVFEVGEHRRQPFFTMKLMEGGSLAERLLAGPLRPREAAGLVSKIARAVHHAHQRGVLHRDIKPGNVLFDAAGEPQLTDFGLAKLVHAESSLTLSSAHLGTPQYMSPEQAAGRVREIGTASDVWALGALLYQLLAGRVPFPGEHHAEIFRQIIEAEPRGMSDDEVRGTVGEGKTPVIRRSRIQGPVPADLETLCLRCLEKEPARRVASAGELADELERWLRGEPIRSRPVTPLERAVKWVRRNRRLSALGAALVFTLLAGSVTATLLWRRAEAARGLAERNAARAESGALAAREAERHAVDSAYFATLAHALAVRRQGDLGFARRLLDGIEPARRQFDWRLLRGLCAGDEEASFDLGQESPPECLAWLPGGTNLVVITADGRLHLRDARGAEAAPARSLPPRPDALDMTSALPAHHALAFAPDGRRFAVAWGNLLRVLDASTFAVLHEEMVLMPDVAWLDADRLLYGGNAAVNSLRGAQGAWVLDLCDGSRVPLPDGLSAPLSASGDRRSVALSRITWHVGQEVEIFPVRTLLTAPAEHVVKLGGSGAGLANIVQLDGDGGAVRLVRWMARIGADAGSVRLRHGPADVLPGVQVPSHAPGDASCADAPRRGRRGRASAAL